MGSGLNTVESAAVNATKCGITQVAKKTGARNRFTPDASATGAHSVFRKEPLSGKISHYETYIPQKNPRNPTPWESIKRYDGQGKGHRNKVLEMEIQTPHIHDPHFPGGVRHPEYWELPR